MKADGFVLVTELTDSVKRGTKFSGSKTLPIIGAYRRISRSEH